MNPPPYTNTYKPSDATSSGDYSAYAAPYPPSSQPNYSQPDYRYDNPRNPPQGYSNSQPTYFNRSYPPQDYPYSDSTYNNPQPRSYPPTTYNEQPVKNSHFSEPRQSRFSDKPS